MDVQIQKKVRKLTLRQHCVYLIHIYMYIIFEIRCILILILPGALRNEFFSLGNSLNSFGVASLAKQTSAAIGADWLPSCVQASGLWPMQFTSHLQDSFVVIVRSISVQHIKNGSQTTVQCFHFFTFLNKKLTWKLDETGAGSEDVCVVSQTFLAFLSITRRWR